MKTLCMSFVDNHILTALKWTSQELLNGSVYFFNIFLVT